MFIFYGFFAEAVPITYDPAYLNRMYKKTTRDIEVVVEPRFLPDQSVPNESHFVWAYQVRLKNRGSETVQLLRRFWRITDAMGRTQEVRGDGVVGKQPVLKPDGEFEYTSGCPLSTPSGIMVGTYQMISKEGELFDIEVPAFSLDSPHQSRRLN